MGLRKKWAWEKIDWDERIYKDDERLPGVPLLRGENTAHRIRVRRVGRERVVRGRRQDDERPFLEGAHRGSHKRPRALVASRGEIYLPHRVAPSFLSSAWCPMSFLW